MPRRTIMLNGSCPLPSVLAFADIGSFGADIRARAVLFICALGVGVGPGCISTFESNVTIRTLSTSSLAPGGGGRDIFMGTSESGP